MIINTFTNNNFLIFFGSAWRHKFSNTSTFAEIIQMIPIDFIY